MWVLKLFMPYLEGSVFSVPCKKYNVCMRGYPISGQIIDNSVILISSGILDGKKEDIKKYISYLKKEKRILNLEQKNNFMIVEAKMHISNALLFQPSVFQIKPSIINSEGEYIFEIGSWDRSKLEKIYEEYKIIGAKMISFKKKIITQVQTISVSPNLTEKQKECFELANKYKYYDYPRKITLKELAAIAKISYSTFQFHLQNAERKVMPNINELLKI